MVLVRTVEVRMIRYDCVYPCFNRLGQLLNLTPYYVRRECRNRGSVGLSGYDGMRSYNFHRLNFAAYAASAGDQRPGIL